MHYGITQDFKVGDTLTISGQIISQTGAITFEKGDKVTIAEVFYTKGYWSKLCPDIYVPEKLSHFKLERQSGHWLLSAFEETKHLKH